MLLVVMLQCCDVNVTLQGSVNVALYGSVTVEAGGDVDDGVAGGGAAALYLWLLSQNSVTVEAVSGGVML